MSADFFLLPEMEYDGMNIRVFRKVYGNQPNFQMTIENDLYSNMYLDDLFKTQDYNYLVSTSLSNSKGWSINQKTIPYLPLSQVYFEKNEIPNNVYSGNQEKFSLESTLINEFEVEDMDEFGDFQIITIKDTVTTKQLMVYYNIKCALDDVIKVKEINAIGYGVEDQMEGTAGLFDLYYFEPR